MSLTLIMHATNYNSVFFKSVIDRHAPLVEYQAVVGNIKKQTYKKQR